MEKKIIYLYVLDTMADWEPGYAISELNSGRYFKKEAPRFDVRTLAVSKNIVTTLGGIKITPDAEIADVDMDSTALLILPGGDTWHHPEHRKVLELAQKFLDRGIAVAAICGATIAMANARMLDQVEHTSNNKDYLIQSCPNYKGSQNFSEKPAVTDNRLITASGVAPLEFAYEILKMLDVFEIATLEAWYNLYNTKKPEYFFALMESIGE